MQPLVAGISGTVSGSVYGLVYGITVTPLEYSIFPQSAQDVTGDGSGAFMVLLQDNPNRDDNNRTQADYSTYNAATGWSKPLPLDSTETTGDFNPVAAQVSDNTLSAAWINLIPGE